MAIYETQNEKGDYIRDFEIRNNLEAAEFFKDSVQGLLVAQGFNKYEGLLPLSLKKKKTPLPLKAIIKTGTMVVHWQNSPDEIWDLETIELRKRMYKVVKQNKDGRLTLKFHQEARNDEKLRTDFELQMGSKAPKSLTNGESSVNFMVATPKLLLSPTNFNFLIENYDFYITPLGKLKKIEK